MRHGRRQSLSLYEGADLRDFITFMILFRSRVNTLKPSEIIVLESTKDLVEKIQQLLPNLDLRNFPSFEPYGYLEHAGFFHDYLEQKVSEGKGAFIQAVWTVIGKPRLYNLLTKAWTEHGPQTLVPWIHWLKWCWMDAMGRNGPIAC
ncbi:hypothetical protein TNCV_3260021 [Trichonephila clavipes]|nr:hypothetical protein TNCV_3260021 [Trichonephila clavipes]